jgi:uncharacterized protein involved in exopolysaccharide biosynthesis
MSNESTEHHNPEESSRKSTEIRYVPVDIRAMDEGDNDIDLIEILKTIWEGRKTILKTVGVFVVTGLIVALLSVVEYTSEVKVMPETQQGMSLGALGGLAQQFGFSTSAQQGGEEISANLYPSIIQSNVFLLELMNYEVTVPEGSEKITLAEYIKDYQKRSWLMAVIRSPLTLKSWVASWFKSAPASVEHIMANDLALQRILTLSDEEWEVLRNIRSRTTATMNTETGEVTVAVEMQDPVIAASVADQVVQNLSDFIIEKRTEKTRRNVEFIEERFEDAKTQFEEAQNNLAAFNDANRGQLTAMARTEEQLLQSRYDLAFNLYNSLAERLEEARIKLQEETPVLNIIDPAAVPDRRSEPNRTLILIVFVILGGLIGIGIVIVEPFAKKMFDEIKK